GLLRCHSASLSPRGCKALLAQSDARGGNRALVVCAVNGRECHFNAFPQSLCRAPELCCPDRLALFSDHTRPSFQAGSNQQHVIRVPGNLAAFVVQETRLRPLSLGYGNPCQHCKRLAKHAALSYLTVEPDTLFELCAGGINIALAESDLSREGIRICYALFLAQLVVKRQPLIKQRPQRVLVSLGSKEELRQAQEQGSNAAFVA